MKVLKIHGVTAGQSPRPVTALPVNDMQRTARQVETPRYKTTVGQEEQQYREPTVEGVQEAVEDINKVLHYMNERLEFSVHEATNRVMVRVLDRETDEIIREIPPEQILDLVAKLQDLVGLLVDERA